VGDKPTSSSQGQTADVAAFGGVSAVAVLPCTDLARTMAWFTEALDFRLDCIAPADDPQRALMSGYGLHLELRRGAAQGPGRLRLSCAEPRTLGLRLGGVEADQGKGWAVSAPNGTVIELVEANPPLVVPSAPQQLVSTAPQGAGDDGVVTGRAGMVYRDLIPGRWGGRFIASQIRIEEGGPVPDSVHFHKIRFQLIYCAAGWVRVAYEDQGEPLVMQPGDCVLQPPEIRHQVLESSAGLAVIEVTCPAEHDTWLDHDLVLPTGAVHPERDFGGQRFVHHVAESTPWTAWRGDGFEQQQTKIDAATGGLATVGTVRCTDTTSSTTLHHDGEFLFLYILRGAISWRCDGRPELRLAQGHSLAVPAGLDSALSQGTADLLLLEVCLPGHADNHDSRD